MKKNIPRLIFWELTKKCNLSCLHCRAEAEHLDYQGELSLEKIKGVIDDLSSFCNPILVLTGGEPLYRDDLFEIASYASDKDLKVALATNGTLLSKDNVPEIKKRRISRVSISLDGWDAVSHDSFRGQPGAFEKALEGISLLRNNKIEFQINTTITKRNIKDLSQIIDLALKEKAAALHLFMLVPVGCGLEIAEEEMVSSLEYEETLYWLSNFSKKELLDIKATCAPHFYRVIRQDGSWQDNLGKNAMMFRTKGCLAGQGVCFISNKGDVQPCGYLPLKAGNVLESSFQKIWQEAAIFKQLRDESLLKGKCGRCEFKKVCGGCRARAYYKFNDFLEEEPFCLYEPQKKGL